MKVVFAETPSPWLVNQSGDISLGLLSLATILKQEGHDTKLIRPTCIEDLGNLSNVDIINRG